MLRTILCLIRQIRVLLWRFLLRLRSSLLSGLERVRFHLAFNQSNSGPLSLTKWRE